MNLFQTVTLNCFRVGSCLVGFVALGSFSSIAGSAMGQSILPQPPLRIQPGITQPSGINDYTNLRTSLFGDAPTLSNIDITQPQGFIDSVGVFSRDNFLGLGQGAVLSTGLARNLAGTNCADGVNPALFNASCLGRLQRNDGATVTTPGDYNAANIYDRDLSNNLCTQDPNNPTQCLPAAPGDVDQLVLKILFTADTPGILSFDYVFGSEEYPEFIPGDKTAASDVFEILLAQQTNGVAVGNSISVASAMFESNTIGQPNAGKTPLDGYTRPIRFSSSYGIGQNTLTLRLADVGDDFYDSAVFLSQFSVNPTPVTSVPTPPLLFGFAWMGFLRWRNRAKKQ
jgi:hypothetical protein